RQDLVLQVIGEDRAEGRIRGAVEGVALERLVLEAERLRWRVHPGVPDREEERLLVERRGVEAAQWRVVVEDEEAAPERRQDEIVFALLQGDVAHRDDRHLPLELHPARAA